MAQIIDRRLNGKNKSTVNRQRFIKRFKRQIKEAVSKAITERSITNIADTGKKITIPAKDISEPIFHHGKGGERTNIHPGNQDFIKGDKIKRPPSGKGSGGGSQASNSGEGTDDFGFEISREEFLEIFFEDLELPHLIKKRINQLESFQWQRAGFAADGVPANLHILRSLKTALGRRMAMGGSYRKNLKVLEHELEQLLDTTIDDDIRVVEIKDQISVLKKKLAAIPFIDTFDLRYANRIKQPKPTTKAVMFCLMDVSGSMDESKKDIAKRFFILLYLFLKRTYEHTDVVFIRHHTSAKEVNEEEFFYSRETGGTVVSSALELMHNICIDRYNKSDWNIYAAQASDGDNWNNDSPRCRDLLSQNIMKLVQYFAYVEIMPRHHQSLWEAYLSIKENNEHFSMQHIEEAKDIYPVFRELFKRQVE